MTKKELASKLVEVGVFATKVQGEKAVNVLFEEMATALSTTGTVDIFGFGKFETVERAARTGRNPKTGEEIAIDASKSVKFKPSKPLKEMVNA